MNRTDVEQALGKAMDRAVARKDWHTTHILAHIEADLFGYDPGCPKPCPFIF